MTSANAIVCSFYTPDDYYGTHARQLREQLDELGIEHELLEITKAPGEDWADTTRRKIGFIRSVCEKHPDKKVFWIDVDCRISYLPDYIANSTADLIGFQRSFGSPLQIGYGNRTRFWEPSFWGIGTSPQARKLIVDADELEKRANVKATDDYFLEEAWRTNARQLTFQMIPTTEIARDRTPLEPGQRQPFFTFGSSGNVGDFKNKVVQHGAGKQVGLRRKLLKRAKQLEKKLPDGIRGPLRRIADSSGVTGALTAGKAKGIDSERTRLLGEVMGYSLRGDKSSAESSLAQFEEKYVASAAEQANLDAASSFLHYSANGEGKLELMWWAKPFPGNFGDWLSPLIVAHYSGAKVFLQSPVKPASKGHIVALGSIGRFIRSGSVVVGTGVSSLDVELNKKATYVSVRGPHTAGALKAAGGPEVSSYGDPGVVISKIFPLERGKTNGRGVLVRHFSHAAIPLRLPEGLDELSVMMSSKEAIAEFVHRLNEYDFVITSAMHVMITCQSYCIPCALISFEGFEENVHGSGIKYSDYALGAGVEVMEPAVMPLDMRNQDLRAMARPIKVSDAKISEVEGHLRLAIAKAAKK